MKRHEYPRPQFVRSSWVNLNGEWAFAFDDENKGLMENWFNKNLETNKTIQVPFVYQSKLSGIEETGFHPYVWYQKEFSLPEEMRNKKNILHFGAVDYEASVFINGKLVGRHEGGHTSFSFDITPYLNKGKAQMITIRVFDPQTDETIPRGKQYWKQQSEVIWYTNSTGIWQTVWVESVNPSHIETVRFTTDLDNGTVIINAEVSEFKVGQFLRYKIYFKDELIANDSVQLVESHTQRAVELYQQHIFRTSFHFHDETWAWSPESPNLFDVVLELEQSNETLDRVESYFGMRKIHTERGMVYLNNKPYYQKLVLDQGYWPDGLLTAPSDEAYKEDIRLAKEMGFNGCRKHQKIEDPRFLYWADQMGYLVWGECAAAPMYSEKAASRITKEWIEIVERDYNHPSIVTWVPINESWGVPHIHLNKQQQAHSLALYYLIHSLDTTRLVISNDGWEMTKTDICAVHHYQHGTSIEFEKYRSFVDDLSTKDNLLDSMSTKWSIYAKGYQHQGEPILLTEFGGIAYKVGESEGWGYTSSSTEDEFINDYARVMAAVQQSRSIHGYCYTQLTDVEQEINGLLTYDRQPKCDLNKIKEINNQYHSQIVQNAGSNKAGSCSEEKIAVDFN
ncbi:glycoside hydrolase family 2 protein [Bacillus sp. mrc49]|uniref:glycoside hydrolase family 2 protein n=1 Tax=Bacillus sp. mrc49 TaxID=2054913 RepID=UPI000C274436|nr:sugar-binding domain-containing protein [Bacillus sp. mrc49]PJN88552.1 glycoside hydrolase family 2 [Bacillus sp. mrc49]